MSQPATLSDQGRLWLNARLCGYEVAKGDEADTGQDSILSMQATQVIAMTSVPSLCRIRVVLVETATLASALLAEPPILRGTEVPHLP